MKSLPPKYVPLISRLGLGLTLLSLHAIILWGFDTPLQKMLLVCHFGFFLVWQPLFQTEGKVNPSIALIFVLGVVLAAFVVNWWLIAFWIAILFGLLSGRILSAKTKNARINFILGASYLLSVLLLWVVPQLLNSGWDLGAVRNMMLYLPALIVGIMLTESEREENRIPPMLDFFYTLAFILFAMVLVLGSFAIQATSGVDYGVVLMRVVFGLALALVIISWVWNPHLGFSGFGQLLSRYLLSLGLPFEEWMRGIATLAERETTSKGFLEGAMREIASLDWVSGLSWKTPEFAGDLGVVNLNKTEQIAEGIHLNLYTKTPLTPALALHVKLLARILGELYAAKRREETLKQNTYMHAIHETGARLTHDIKNIIQSLSTLCTAAEHTSEDENDKLVNLIRRQLPQLNQRLSLTLDKLKKPAEQVNNPVSLQKWWDDLRTRHQQSSVVFIADSLKDIQVDEEVMTSVVDNLIQNAIEKSRHETGIAIEVEINHAQDVCVEVSDTGSAVPQAISEQLFKVRIQSENGLGIGLYQAGKQAEQAGYLLALVENQNGEVRFRLSRSV